MAVEEKEGTLDAELDETLRATLKDIQERGDDETPAEATTPAELAPAAEPLKAERARDDAGKFIKAEDKSKESAAPAGKPDNAQTLGPPAQAAAESTEAVAPPQGIDLARAPSSWKPAAKAAWNALPEPVRAEIYRREGDFHTGLKDIKTNADFGQAIRQVIDPYRMLIEAEGGTPEKAVGDLLRTAALFRTGTPQAKLQAIFDISKQFNVPLGEYMQAEFAKAKGEPGHQPPLGQQPQQFQDSRVDQLLAKMQKDERLRAADEERVSNAATERFLAAKDDKGQPLYPFVDNVLDDMSARVGNLRRLNPALGHEEALKQAYDAAVWAHPETRAVLLSQQQAQAQQSAETLRKVEAAKRANAGNMPKRGSLPASASVGPLKLGTSESDESIRETYRQLTG